MSSQQPPPPPSSSKNLLFCTTDTIQPVYTQQSFATISLRDILKLREQGNVTWKDVCEKSTIRHFPSEPSSNKVDDNKSSNSTANTATDQPNELNKLEDDQMMETGWPKNNSKQEQEIALLKDENRKLCAEKVQVLSFLGELHTCLGATWNGSNEEQIKKELLSGLSLQACLDRIKQMVQKGEEDKLELEKLKETKQPTILEPKIMISRDSQTKFTEGINLQNTRRRKKRVCKVIGTNLQEYWCSCGRTFANRDRIAAHIKINQLSWKFKCSECTLKFADLKTLKAHLETTHKIKNPIDEYNRGCIFCGKMFEFAEELTQHTENHKKEWVKNRKAVNYIKTTNQAAANSLRNKKKKAKRVLQKLAVEPIKLTTKRKRTLFKCRLCTRTFSDHARFQRHTSLEHKNEDD